jgi:hypothetical protein
MQIQRSGRVNDIFAQELVAKLGQRLPTAEKRLEEQRDEKGYEPPNASLEGALEDDKRANRKDEELPAYEKLLREQEHVESPNTGTAGITEKRLNEASHQNYPHRNPEAYKRTEDKRQVNALDEEMGKAGDDSKQERQEAASGKTPIEKRVVDKDIGKQMDDKKAFNFKKSKQASVEDKAAKYIRYRNSFVKRLSGLSGPFNSVRDFDAQMTGIMAKASSENRHLNDEEAKKIDALKAEKSALLGLR